ncbi:MAG TPA: class I SAM-dependent methyltransferase [Thermoanaerobaculia bacterium]|nr:class I SAM-dependent methyltransferase [Thermoanaerobaculia bacterium]
MPDLLRPIRRLYRRVFPRIADPWLDSEVVPAPRDSEFERVYASALTAEELRDPFVEARYREGRRWRSVLDRLDVGGDLVLDLGAGNGAVALAGSAGGYRVVAVDALWNEVARRTRAKAGGSFHYVIADGRALPFLDGAFGAMLCLETIEHFQDAAKSGAEASRVLRGGGAIVLITPARLAWIFRPDPHFGIRGLLLLPAALQRRVAMSRGFDQVQHFVDRIYTTAREIEDLFPECRIERVMTRSRLPKRWFWDALLLRKQ